MSGGTLSIVRAASQQLASLLVEEAKFLYAVNEKMEKLHLRLQCIQCFLEDADRNQYKSQLISQWISQIREFAYEAGDIIDKFVVRVSCKNREEGFWNALKWFSCVLCDAQSLHQVGSDIDILSRRISELNSTMQLCGLKVDVTQDTSMVTTELAELRRTNSQIKDEDFIVGFTEDVDVLVHHLIHNHKKITIISGMGGLGKTTLAKMVYKNKRIREHFDNFVWVFVSQQFAVRDVLEAIAVEVFKDDETIRKNLQGLQLQSEINQLLQQNALQSEINQKLQQKSYLVVLDDVWNDESWNRLKVVFQLPQESGSKLLLTTRNEGLLKYMDDDNNYRYQPTILTVEECWNLLHKIVAGGRYVIDPEMEKLGKEMIEDCNFLPLAVATLGGILVSKKTKHEWMFVKENIHLYLTSQEGSVVMQVLELSYKELPFYLRPCFLYLANYPEDFEIKTTSLYHMWVAEGLVMLPSDNDIVVMGKTGISIEDMAERYLNELVKRCLVQVVKRGKRGNLKSCRLHDIIRDMCIKKAKEENFLSITTTKELSDMRRHGRRSTTFSTARRLHRLTIHFNEHGDYAFGTMPMYQHLRSLLFFSVTTKFISVIRTSSVLRVLHLEHARIVSLPKGIGKLIHLRYLSLFSTVVLIRSLPSSLGDLSHLETLDLRLREHFWIPNVLWKLKRLRHLYLPANLSPWNGKLELHSLPCLETLEGLILCFYKFKDNPNLKSLRKLTWGVYKPRMCCFSGTTLLKVLLSIYAASPVLSENNLTISMSTKMLSSTKEVKKMLKFPGFELVKGLKILDSPLLAELDCVEILLCQMTKLEFEGTQLRYDPMPVLERLSNLESLTLSKNCFTVRKITCSAGGFPELTYLKISGCTELEEWEVERGSMPKLEKLKIYECGCLKQLPDAVMGRTSVEIHCKKPCIPGIEKHSTCPRFKGRVDDDTNNQVVPYEREDQEGGGEITLFQ